MDVIAVIASNDAWVMSAWSKANGIKNDKVVRATDPSLFENDVSLTLRAKLFMTDVDAKFSKQIGWTKGERTGRYAIVIDHGKVVYAEIEPAGDVTVSKLPP